MRSPTVRQTNTPSTLSNPIHTKASADEKLTRNKAGDLVSDASQTEGEPRDLNDTAGTNLQPTRDKTQALREPQGKALAEVTSSDDPDPPILSIDSEKWDQVFTPESAPDADDPAPLVAVDKVTDNASPKRVKGQLPDTPDNDEYFEEASLSPAKTAPERKQTVPGSRIDTQITVTQAELKEAHDAVKQGRTELNLQRKALKLETRASLFMAGMQVFVDKLARKYGLKDQAVLPLKQLFAQAEQKLQHSVERRMQLVEQATTTLEDHTRQAAYLSSLARGGKQGQIDDGPLQPRHAQTGNAPSPAPLDGLTNCLTQLDDTEQALVKKAGQFGQEVISNDAEWYDDISQGEADGYLARLAQLNGELNELENSMKQNVSPSAEIDPLSASAKAIHPQPSAMSLGELAALAQQQVTDQPKPVR